MESYQRGHILEIEYVPVEYEPTEVILAKINVLEKDIQKELAELAELLKEN